MNMVFNFFRIRRYKKMINTGANFVLQDFAEIVAHTINRLETEGRIKSSLHKEVLKFEFTAVIFWFFRRSEVFPEVMHRSTLDEVHQLYFSKLKKSGYTRDQVQLICEDLNERYRLYDKLDNPDDFVKIGTNFAKIISNRANTEIDATEIIMPIALIEQVKSRFEEYRTVLQS